MTSSQCAFSQRKVVSQFQKWNEQLCVLFMPDLQELHRTNEPKAERIHTTRLQTVYLLGPEPRAALDHATTLYTALGDTVNKAVELTAASITSLSNLVRSIQIQRRILLKLQTSEQMPLMWKPGETLFNKHIITTIHHGFNIVKLQEQLVAEIVFLNASHNFSQHFKALSITEFLSDF